jgi:hypothetical protein
MMANFNKFHLTEHQKGFLYIILGVIVLLYAFGFFKAWLNTLVILAGALITAYGFIKVDGVEWVQSLFSKRSK